MSARMMTPLHAHVLGAAMAASLAIVGCGGGSAAESSLSATEGQAGSGGEQASGGGGTVDPYDDDDGSSASEDAEGETSSGEGQAASEPESPWGTTLDQEGAELPKRTPIASKAKSSYDNGVAKSRAGDVSGARKAFESALKKDSGNYLILYNLGVVADHAGDTQKALDYYRKSLMAQPDYELAAAGIVAIYLRQGNAAQAESFISPLAARWERNLYLQALYADLLTHMGRPAEASTAARKALRRDEKFVPAMISLAKANLKEGKTELAESILEQATEIDPKNAELHFLKGNQLMEDEQLALALAEYREAVKLRPDYPEARMALGIRLLAGANYDEALTQFKELAKLVPDLVEVHLALGDAYRASKKWKMAKRSFDRALSIKSDLPEAHYNLGLMYMTAGEEFPEMDLLQALDAAKREFQTYRGMLGGKLGRDDLSGSYIEDIEKRISREQTRLEREARRKQQEAERAAREAGGEEAAE